MITRAQLNAALRDLEERMKKDTDLRLKARMTELRQETEERLSDSKERPLRQEEDLRLLVEESLARLQEDCQRNTEEICALRAKAEELEQILDLLAGRSAATEEDEEIRDDLGS
jgi:predicted ribosome quality control (RQC) complex YloA/Tae2 family protein